MLAANGLELVALKETHDPAQLSRSRLDKNLDLPLLARGGRQGQSQSTPQLDEPFPGQARKKGGKVDHLRHGQIIAAKRDSPA